MKYNSGAWQVGPAGGLVLQQVYLERWQLPALFLLISGVEKDRELLRKKGKEFQEAVLRLSRQRRGNVPGDYDFLWQDLPGHICGMLAVGERAEIFPGDQARIYLVQSSFGKPVLQRPFEENGIPEEVLLAAGCKMFFATPGFCNRLTEAELASYLGKEMAGQDPDACMRELGLMGTEKEPDAMAERMECGIYVMVEESE